MSSEKQNNGWKDNLLAWERSGGDSAHAEEQLWEKLQTRLQPRPSRRNVYFLRAAAILILLAGSFLLWQNGRPSSALPVPPVTKTGAPPVMGYTRPGNEKRAVLPQVITAAPVPLKTGPSRVTVPADTGGSNLATPALPVRDTSPVLADAPADALTPGTSPEPATRQKKLKIVHMNEWNAPPPPAYATQKDRTPAFLEADPENDLPAGPSIWPGKNKNRMLTASRN